MTKPNQDNAPDRPALIVFGTLRGEGPMRAARFRLEQATAARTAARHDGIFSIEIDSQELREIARSLKDGGLSSGGHLQLPPVSPDVIGQLVAYQRARHPPLDVPVGPDAALGMHRLANRPRSSVPKALWDVLTLTDVVLAAQLENGEPTGWWEAVILNVQYGTFTLRWCDYPDDGLFKRQRKPIALLFPE